MSNEKQQKILDMAKDICRVKLNCNDVCNPISACDALKYAERAVEAGYKKQEWISVEERLPNEFVSVLGYMMDAGDFPPVRECYLVGRAFFFPALNDKHPVSQWMPLPEVPKMKGDRRNES